MQRAEEIGGVGGIGFGDAVEEGEFVGLGFHIRMNHEKADHEKHREANCHAYATPQADNGFLRLKVNRYLE